MKHWIHIGIQKAASSFLRGLLAQVTDISLANQQELNFFKTVECRSHSAYLKCFSEARPVLFENSPVYFRTGKTCAQAISQTLRGKKLMLSLLLRDPVDAILSHHDMRIRQGFFAGNSTYEGDPLDLKHFIHRNPHYIDDWRYMSILEHHWLPHFNIEDIMIRTFEEFTARPVESVREFAAQVGLSDVGTLNTEGVWKNPGPSSAIANRLLQATGRNDILRAVRRRATSIPALRKLAERALFGRAPRSRNWGPRSSDLRVELAHLLEPEVMRLCNFLGRESLPWRNFFNEPRPQPR